MSAFTFPRVHPTAAVLRELFAAGFSPVSWGEAKIDVDGSIELSARVSVQVGESYFMVVVRNLDGFGTFTFYPERHTIRGLVADIRRALTATA